MTNVAKLRQLTDEEVLTELNNLDGTNGCAAEEYREGVAVTMEAIIRNVIALVEEHGSYPVEVSRDSDFWFLLSKLENGEYELLENWERANFVVETSRSVGEPVELYAGRLAWPMFRKHLNGVRVIGGEDA